MYITFDSSVTHTDGDISSVDSECVTDYLEVSLHFENKTSDVSNTILSNIDRTRTSFFEHRTNSNMFINN